MADVNDWVTLAEAKSALDIASGDTTQDDLLEISITSLSQKLDLCVGPVVERTVTDEIHDGSYSTTGISKCVIEARHSPVKNYISVIEYRNSAPLTLTEQTPGVVPIDSFFSPQSTKEAPLYDGMVERLVNGYPAPFWPGKGNIVLTYEAGRAADTANVKTIFKSAILVAIKNWWRQYQLSVMSSKPQDEFQRPHQNFPAFTIPNATAQMLMYYWKPTVGFGA